MQARIYPIYLSVPYLIIKGNLSLEEFIIYSWDIVWSLPAASNLNYFSYFDADQIILSAYIMLLLGRCPLPLSAVVSLGEISHVIIYLSSLPFRLIT